MPQPLYPPGQQPGTRCVGGWMGPRASLGKCGKSRHHRECFCSCFLFFLSLCPVYTLCTFTSSVLMSLIPLQYTTQTSIPPRRDPNPQFQQGIGCRHSPQTARPLGSANTSEIVATVQPRFEPNRILEIHRYANILNRDSIPGPSCPSRVAIPAAPTRPTLLYNALSVPTCYTILRFFFCRSYTSRP